MESRSNNTGGVQPAASHDKNAQGIVIPVDMTTTSENPRNFDTSPVIETTVETSMFTESTPFYYEERTDNQFAETSPSAAVKSNVISEVPEKTRLVDDEGSFNCSITWEFSFKLNIKVYVFVFRI